MEGAPYRGGSAAAPPIRAEDTGLVADLIAQFADPLAFYRELIQNAIDAGSESITVRISWEDGTALVAVRDVGVGMSREIIEEELLVLFRSGKENREDAIGKFGVGFVSVLGVSPELVEVHTTRGDGVAHVLHLRTDQSWDLFEVGGGSAAGTTVTLRIPLDEAGYDNFVLESGRALSRWCRHARVPIHFVANSLDGTSVEERRIDKPLALEDALVSVEVQSGTTRAIVGLLPDKGSYAGFFNGGLTLLETTSPLLEAVSFKVQDPHLEHTLSRDDVRRDEAFRAAMRVVEKAAREELPTAVADALADASGADPRRYRALLQAIADEAVLVPRSRITVPLIEPVAGSAMAGAATLESLALFARSESPLTAALARKGTRVLDARGHDDDEVARFSRIVFGREGRDVHRLYTLISKEPLEGFDAALLSHVSELLAEVARAPSAIHLARLTGRGAGRFHVAASAPEENWVAADEIDDDPLRMLLRPDLVLNAEHPLVAAARTAMTVEPEIAAAFLARAVLLETGRLDGKRDDALTASVLSALLGGAK